MSALDAASATTVAYGYDEMLAVQAARRYYLEDKTKSEIAAELKISRFKVARLLARARDEGIVKISITSPEINDERLADALRERFGLTHATVLPGFEMDDTALRAHLGQAAAELLDSIIEPDDTLGLGWARAVLACAARLRSISAAQVVQLTGALNRSGTELSPVELVRRVAHLAGASVLSFHAPMLVSDSVTAAALRREPQIVRAMQALPQVTKAVVGVGGWRPAASLLYNEISHAERDRLIECGVFADISGVLIDRHGSPVNTPITDRIIAIGAPELRSIPEVIAIAYGVEKAAAARAAIEGGYITSLVTHAEFAERLLAQ